MLDSIYIGLTGLTGYSKGLGVVSNNVANLNTAGFKGGQLQFADLYYKDGGQSTEGAPARMGAGLATGGTHLNFQTGEARDTGNDLDLMIDGPGLFVLLQDDGQAVYSRAGQFEFNADGVLVDRMNGARLAVRDGGGGLSEISLDGWRHSPHSATRTVELSGNLSSDDTQHVIASTTVYDSTGTARQVRITFDNANATTPNAWTVTVALADNTVIGTGELRFDAGRPTADHASVAIDYTPAAGGAGIAFSLHLSGDALSSAAGAESTLQVLSQDGHAAGSLMQTSFNSDGVFVTTYSNGETEEHGRLAMAWFTSPGQVEQLGNNLFSFRDGATPQIGVANADGMGAIRSRAVELSNVDLAKQFSELIITQRGYQASSQVITTANEMIQQLMDLRGKR